MKMKKNNLLYNSENTKIASIAEACQKSFEQDEIKRNCKKIASGIIFRLHINKNSVELTTILGDGSAQDNFHAISDWILDNEPDLMHYSHEKTEEYTLKLANILDEARYNLY